MRKYQSVLKISLAQELVYKTNFIMWRVRNILQIFLVFFLWDTIYSNPGVEYFGYDRVEMLTYVFGLLIIRAFVLSARATDVAGEVARGDLANYLLKPVSYFKYWLTRDVSSKSLNLVFALVETTVLYFILRPSFYFQTNPTYLMAFAVLIVLAILIFFTLIFIASAVPFWMPEAGWGLQFVVVVILVEFLSGALFPLDILPQSLFTVISYTPYPYLIYFPIQVYLGKLSVALVFKGILISTVWVILLWTFMKYLWGKGLKVYQSQGR